MVSELDLARQKVVKAQQDFDKAAASQKQTYIDALNQAKRDSKSATQVAAASAQKAGIASEKLLSGSAKLSDFSPNLGPGISIGVPVASVPGGAFLTNTGVVVDSSGNLHNNLAEYEKSKERPMSVYLGPQFKRPIDIAAEGFKQNAELANLRFVSGMSTPKGPMGVYVPNEKVGNILRGPFSQTEVSQLGPNLLKESQFDVIAARGAEISKFISTTAQKLQFGVQEIGARSLELATKAELRASYGTAGLFRPGMDLEEKKVESALIPIVRGVGITVGGVGPYLAEAPIPQIAGLVNFAATGNPLDIAFGFGAGKIEAGGKYLAKNKILTKVVGEKRINALSLGLKAGITGAFAGSALGELALSIPQGERAYSVNLSRQLGALSGFVAGSRLAEVKLPYDYIHNKIEAFDKHRIRQEFDRTFPIQFNELPVDMRVPEELKMIEKTDNVPLKSTRIEFFSPRSKPENTTYFVKGKKISAAELLEKAVPKTIGGLNKEILQLEQLQKVRESKLNYSERLRKLQDLIFSQRGKYAPNKIFESLPKNIRILKTELKSYDLLEKKLSLEQIMKKNRIKLINQLDKLRKEYAPLSLSEPYPKTNLELNQLIHKLEAKQNVPSRYAASKKEFGKLRERYIELKKILKESVRLKQVPRTLAEYKKAISGLERKMSARNFMSKYEKYDLLIERYKKAQLLLNGIDQPAIPSSYLRLLRATKFLEYTLKLKNLGIDKVKSLPDSVSEESLGQVKLPRYSQRIRLLKERLKNLRLIESSKKSNRQNLFELKIKNRELKREFEKLGTPSTGLKDETSVVSRAGRQFQVQKVRSKFRSGSGIQKIRIRRAKIVGKKRVSAVINEVPVISRRRGISVYTEEERVYFGDRVNFDHRVNLGELERPLIAVGLRDLTSIGIHDQTRVGFRDLTDLGVRGQTRVGLRGNIRVRDAIAEKIMPITAIKPTPKIISSVKSISILQETTVPQIDFPIIPKPIIHKRTEIQPVPEKIVVPPKKKEEPPRNKKLDLPLSNQNNLSSFSNLGGQAFNVLVRQAEKYVKVNTKPLAKESAINFGGYFVENTPARSFVLKKVSGIGKHIKFPKIISSHFRAPKINSKLSRASIVEKTAFAINTLGEKQGISLRGLAARAKNKQIKRFFALSLPKVRETKLKILGKHSIMREVKLNV